MVLHATAVTHTAGEASVTGRKALTPTRGRATQPLMSYGGGGNQTDLRFLSQFAGMDSGRSRKSRGGLHEAPLFLGVREFSSTYYSVDSTAVIKTLANRLLLFLRIQPLVFSSSV